ncbi:MAG: M48 family metallopeptidase [Candidatus Ratteibacteria bacterium]|jgi:predicted Zn-dependent protease
MLKKRFLLGIFLLFAGISLGGCATVYNPVTNRQETSLYSTQDEITVGESVDRQIRKEYKPSSDANAVKWVKKVGQKVAERSGRGDVTFRFEVMESKDVNAFAGPGGYVYVTTGLLKLVSSEDELACVLGHEVGHVAARHAIKQMQSQVLYSVPASIIFSESKYSYIEKAVSVAFNLTQLSYSRKDELQADTLGMSYARQAGYDPAGMVSFLRKLGEIEQKEPRLIIAPLSTHPATSIRIENAVAWIGKQWKLTGVILEKNRFYD